MASLEELKKKYLKKDEDDEEEKKSLPSTSKTSNGNKSKSKLDELTSKYLTTSMSNNDVDKWLKDANDILSGFTSKTDSDYSKYRNADTTKVKKLLESSNDVWKYLRTNKDQMSNYTALYQSYNQINNALKSVIEANEIYSQFETEDEYKRHSIGWLNTESGTTSETALARQEYYQGNKDRVADIEEELPWYAKSWLPNFVEDIFLSKENEALRDEAEALEAENNKYINLQGKLDKHYMPITDEVTQIASKRDYSNASMEDLNVHDAGFRDVSKYLGDGVHYLDDDGNVVNSYTQKVVRPADEYSRAMLNNDTEGFYNSVIQDKLGMFLSASEADLTEAYNRLSASHGNTSDVWANTLRDGDVNGWKQLTDNEITIYYYKLNTEGQEAAYKFLEDMTTELTRRETEQRAKEIGEAGLLEQIALNIASIPMNVVGGAIAFGTDAIDIIRGDEIDPYSRAHAWQNDASVIREETAKDLDNLTGNIAIPWLDYSAGDVYQALMSGADSYFGGKFFGSTGYGMFMGMGAASSTAKDLYERGASNGQIIVGSLAAGIAEGIFEKYSIDKFVNMGDTKSKMDFVINILKQGGVEASEEAFTEIANIITDSIVMGSQAEVQDLGTFVKNVVNASISGFISGGGMGAVGSGASYAQYAQQRNDQGQAIIDKGGTDYLKQLALEMSGASKGDKKITKLANKVEQNASAKNVGKLSAQMENTITKQNSTDIQKALVEKGLTEKDAKRVAEYLGSAKALTAEQKAEVESNENIKAVVKELLDNPKSAISERGRNFLAARLGIDYKNAKVKASESGKLSLRNNVDITEKVSETGKTTITETDENGKEITTDITIDKSNPIAKVKYVKDAEGEVVERKVYFNTDHGIVEASKVKYANEEEGLVYEAFADMNPAFANAVIKNYDGSVPIQTYINGMREGMILYGMHNFKAVGADISKNSFLADLSEADQAFALKLGRAYAKADAKKANKDLRSAIKKAAEKAKASEEGSTSEAMQNKPKKGNVYFEDGAKAETHKQHKKIISLSKHLAKAIGIDIVFYDSRITGKKAGQGANGYYDADTDTIYLDLQNAHNDAKTIAYTLSHELVHFIKKWSPQKFNTFAEFLMEQYASHGVSAANLLKQKMVELNTTDADFAYEEMIADACETMLLDSNAVVKLMELRKSDLELFEKIKLHILKILNDIREAYKSLGYQPTSDEAKALLGMKDVLEKFYAMFEEVAVDATQNYQALGTEGYNEFVAKSTENANRTVFGEASVDMGKTESGVKHQLKAHRTIGEASIAYNERHKKVHKAILQVGVESMYEMAEAMLPYLDEEGILPPDIPGKTIFKNGSYGRTGENTTLCVRTLTYEDFKDRVAEKVGRPLTVSESLLVSQKIYDIATEPQCIYCYVAADRKAYDEYLGEYWKAMDKYIKAMRKGGDSKALYTEYLAGRKDTDAQKKRWSQWEAIAKSGKEYISANDLTTKRKRDGIIARKNAFSEQIKDAQRYAQSASWAKTVFDYRAYKGDILKMTSTFVDMLNSEYGLRMYSFSDYTPAFIVENMQMIIDASVKGLKSLAYTKDTDYAEIFASTGQAINVSCFAKWDAEKGTFVEDNRQGANWDKTKSLRKQYRNVGAVMVATNDDMVEWALKQDWVDVVIPYHIVKTGTTIANEYQWNNYTSESSDKAGNRAANIYPTEHNNDFATYSDLLKERGITPRFSRWFDKVASGELTEEQYMKLVNEVRLPASELSPVVPSFNLDAAKKSFGIDNEGKVIEGGFVDKGGYMGGWYRQGVDVNQEVMSVSEDIKAGKSSLDVDYGMSKAGKERVEERYKKQAKKNKDNFVEDKYFRTQMQKWDNLPRGSYVKVGEIKEEHPLVKVGMPQGIIKYDVDKLNKNMAKHTYLDSNLLEAIPDIIANPIAISEYTQESNTVSVFGNVFVGSSPMMVGVTIAKDRSGTNISKVRTYNARRDVGTLITDDTVLYLNEDKKRTRKWFQICGIQVPLGETKFGFIRSISQKDPSVKKQLKKSSNKDYAPTFYSQMGREIDAIKMDKIGASSLVNYLKGKGIKHDEIKWSGIEAFLEGKKSVTKAELQEFVAGSQLQIVEQTSNTATFVDDDGNTYTDNEFKEKAYAMADEQGIDRDRVKFVLDPDDGSFVAYVGSRFNGVILEAEADELGTMTRWSEYKLDGGSNYRELVFQMPNSSYSNRAMKVHWGEDAEGVLAHARIQDFEVDGKKMLFIEEIQSDWHNEGHQKGYVTKEYEDALAVYDKLAEDYANKRRAFNKYVRSGDFRSDPDDVSKKKFDWLRRKMDEAEKRMQDAERDVEALKEKGMGDVPDAPFRDTYHEYVLKRLLRMAAEEGYDLIGWTPAYIQSERWSDEFAEGYRIEYDQDIPKFLKKYGKRWGATVGKTAIEGNGEITYTSDSGVKYNSIREWFDSSKEAIYLVYGDHLKGKLTVKEEGTTLYVENKETGERYPSKLFVHEGNQEVWSMSIPGTMKDSVLYEGQPKFQKKKLTNRTILSNALETTAQNDIERNKLAQYKEKIALVEAEEEKLADLRGRIKELSFAKGPRDTAAIKKLQFEANQTANRINTYDRQLLNLESTTALKGVLEREKQMAYKRAEQKGKEALEAYREKMTKTQRELLTRYKDQRKEQRERATERRDKTSLRRRIRKIVKELNSLFKNGTKKRNIKQEMKDTVATSLALAEVLFNDDIKNEDIVRLGVASVTTKESEYLDKYRDLLDLRDSLRADIESIYANGNVRETMLADVAKVQEKIKKVDGQIAYLNNKLSDLFERERARLNKATVDAIIDDLVSEYSKLKDSENGYIKNAYNEAMEMRLVALKESFKGTVAKDMDVYQLQELYDTFKAVMHMIRHSNSLFRDGRTEDLMTYVSNVQGEIYEASTDQKDRNVIADKIARTLNEFSWNNLRPVDAVERLGSQTFEKLFWDFVHAMGVAARDITEAGEVIASAREKFGYSKWNMELAETTYTTRDGLTFKPSLADKLSIYAYSQREQAEDHMTEGGFTYDTGRTYKETENGKTYVRRKLSNTYRLSKEDIQTIISSLTDEQRGYVDAILPYLTDMGKKGNEVSMTLYGIELFGEKVYFPLQSSRDYLSSTTQTLGATPTMASLANSGFTKQTTPHASNPIVLRSFDDVVLEHIEKMSNYHALVIPIENLRRVFDNVGRETEGMPIATKALIGSRFGEEAQKYFEQWLTDINGGISPSGAKSILGKLFSRAKGTSVAANLSVVAQQYFAIIRAMEVVDTKYFIPFINSDAKKTDTKQYEELLKYAPIAIIKEMGGFDVGSRGRVKDYIGYEGARKDAKYLKKKADDLWMWGAGKMDELGWVTIWKAVKSEVASEQKLTPGTDEFYEACRVRFTEVVTKTQVFDSVASRSGYMRSQHDAVKYATSFMGEPTAIVGRIFGAGTNFVRAYKSGNKARIKSAWGRLGRVATVIVVSNVLGKLAQSLVYGGRDDDEDEALLERWMRNFAEALADDLKWYTPLNYLPFGRDIVSTIEGWDVERPDMTLIADVIKSVKKVTDGDLTLDDSLKLIGSVGNFFGLPLKNIIREIKSAINVVGDVFDDIQPTDVGGALVEGFTGDERSKTEMLYDSIMRGDTERVEVIKATYKTETAYTTALRKALTENDPRIAEAVMSHYEGDITKRAAIVKEIASEGYFTQDLVQGAVNNAITNFNTKKTNAIKAKNLGKTAEYKKLIKELREMYPKEFVEKMLNDTIVEDEADAESNGVPLYSINDYYTSILNGNTSATDTIFKELINEKLAEGYLQVEAEDSIASSVATKVKEAYMDGDVTRSKAISLLVSHGNKSTSEAEVEVKKCDFELKYDISWSDRVRAYRLGELSESSLISAVMDIDGATSKEAEEYIRFLELEMDNPYLDISVSDAEKYFEYAEPANIGIDVYLDYKEQTKGLESDKDANGNSISGSKKAKVMAVINSLPISSSQKDALYFAEGWTASKLWEAPWH